MSRVKHGSGAVYDAAARWKTRCLLSDGSVFTDRQIWIATALDELDTNFVRNLDWGEGGFWEKLKAQLVSTSREAKQLAAEMCWVMFLIPVQKSQGAETKRSQIREVWRWSGEELSEDNPQLGVPLEEGIANPGTAFHTHRWRELVFFITAIRRFKALDDANRARVLNDPFEFAGFLDAMDESRGRQLRHALPHLLFPESFEPVVSGKHKRAIVRAFLEPTDPGFEAKGSRLEIDRSLLVVREKLFESYGQDFNFYAKEVKEHWAAEKGAAHDPPVYPDHSDATEWYRGRFGSHRVWLMGAGQGARLWPQFESEGQIALHLSGVEGDLSEFDSKDQISKEIAAARGVDNPFNDALAAWQFSREMSVGDFVIAKRGRSVILGVGRITSDYRFDVDRAEYGHLRAVEWERTGRWEIPRDQWVTPKTLTDFSDEAYHPWLHEVVREVVDAGKTLSPPDEAEGYSVERAIEGLFIPAEQFRKILDELARKKNVILEGPPGVGKTFMAKRIAWALMGRKDPRRLQMIQFHQSYAYEDFIQGWRPTATGGFELRNGVFYEFCRAAAEDDPTKPWVFIIDEINRANLSKVFGELMMLIEADKRGSDFGIPLTYAMGPEDRFSVPPNVHIIGMMNTADRSLAMVDYALRRRFSFIRLAPAFQREEFSSFLLDARISEDLMAKIRSRMNDLNERIRGDVRSLGPGFEIGHSYFVPDPEQDEQLDDEWFERVVRTEIEPLLTEYWFDSTETAKEAVQRLLQ